MSNIQKKYTFRFGDRKIVFVKQRDESEDHVLGKAVLFALYGDRYPGLKVEVGAGAKYRPDLICFGADEKPVFWGESGVVSKRKLRYLIKKYPSTHIVFLRHTFRIGEFAKLVEAACRASSSKRNAPVEVVGRPPDLGIYIGAKDDLLITRADCRIVIFDGGIVREYSEKNFT